MIIIILIIKSEVRMWSQDPEHQDPEHQDPESLDVFGLTELRS